MPCSWFSVHALIIWVLFISCSCEFCSCPAGIGFAHVPLIYFSFPAHANSVHVLFICFCSCALLMCVCSCVSVHVLLMWVLFIPAHVSSVHVGLIRVLHSPHLIFFYVFLICFFSCPAHVSSVHVLLLWILWVLFILRSWCFCVSCSYDFCSCPPHVPLIWVFFTFSYVRFCSCPACISSAHGLLIRVLFLMWHFVLSSTIQLFAICFISCWLEFCVDCMDVLLSLFQVMFLLHMNYSSWFCSCEICPFVSPTTWYLFRSLDFCSFLASKFVDDR